jgi:hypothetical protein
VEADEWAGSGGAVIRYGLCGWGDDGPERIGPAGFFLIRDDLPERGNEMPRARLKAVGFCAWMNEVGDRAFEFALALARRYRAQLDIFIFPCSPCLPHDSRGRSGELLEMSEEEMIEAEKEVRLYYDDRLGDYIDAGYRLCLGDEAPELRHCLFDRQYDILVLPYEKEGVSFGMRTIEEFAHRMQCPVVLVGPVGDTEVHINRPARLWLTELGLEDATWTDLPLPVA